MAKIARIPPKTVSSDDKELLGKLEGNLKMTVFGQDAAVSQMVGAMKLARAGLAGRTETDRVLPVSRTYWCRQNRAHSPACAANGA